MLGFNIITKLCRDNNLKIELLPAGKYGLYFECDTIFMSLDWKEYAHIDDNFVELVLCIGGAFFSKNGYRDDSRLDALNWALDICEEYGVEISREKEIDLIARYDEYDISFDTILFDKPLSKIVEKYGFPVDVVLTSYYGDFFYRAESIDRRTQKISGMMFKDGEKYRECTYPGNVKCHLYNDANADEENLVMDEEIQSVLDKNSIDDNKSILKLDVYFKTLGFEVIDNRKKGGAFWVVGSQEDLSDAVESITKVFKISGKFSEGGRATKHRFAWWTKDNDPSFSQEEQLNRIINNVYNENNDIQNRGNIIDETTNLEEDYITLEEGEICLTKAQQVCVDYVGEKNKNLAIRSCPGGGWSSVKI